MSGDQIATLIGSLLSGGLGGLAAVLAYAHGYFNIEKIERRKQKIELTKELIASRYVLVDGGNATDNELRDFNRAMALIPYVYSDDKNVIAALDVFLNNRADDNLMRLLDAVILASGLKRYSISRTHLSRAFYVSQANGARRMG